MSLEDLLKEELEKWRKDNEARLSKLGPDLAKLTVNSALAAVIPKKALTPKLATAKMQYAANALKASVTLKKNSDALQADLKNRLIDLLAKTVALILTALA